MSYGSSCACESDTFSRGKRFNFNPNGQRGALCRVIKKKRSTRSLPLSASIKLEHVANNDPWMSPYITEMRRKQLQSVTYLCECSIGVTVIIPNVRRNGPKTMWREKGWEMIRRFIKRFSIHIEIAIKLSCKTWNVQSIHRSEIIIEFITWSVE